MSIEREDDMRKPLVAANWKMHHTQASASAYLRRLVELVPDDPPLELVIFPPATALHIAKAELAGTKIYFGAQNAHPDPKGAFTGEISILQVADLGARFLLCGHSERRLLFHEDDEFVAAKVRAAIKWGLVPILCVGEKLSDRQAGRTWSVVQQQLVASLTGIELKNPAQLVIAYEPVWAIGTGVPALPADVQDMARRIRGWLRQTLGDWAEEIRIQYGGSVTPENARDFLQLPDIDGALVGGASLDPETFWVIAQAGVR